MNIIEAVNSALADGAGWGMVEDYQGETAFAVWERVQVSDDITWAMVAKIDRWPAPLEPVQVVC